MKQITIGIITLLFAASAFADADKGQKYYLKYLRPYFDYNGQVFAQQHLKIEWARYFKDDGAKFIKTYSKTP